VVAVTHAGQVSTNVEVDALCRGAALLSREDNRIAARALLWAAVAIDPQNFVAHRRLAAALLNGDDLNAAAEEYARFIELLLKEDDVRRAAAELAYARSFLGDTPQLRAAADHPVPLGDVANVIDPSTRVRPSAPLALADYAATRARSHNVTSGDRSKRARSLHRPPWYRRLGAGIGIGEYILLLALVTASALAVLRFAGYIVIRSP
jgi:tetratricopeptide (TPR) repeat protein